MKKVMVLPWKWIAVIVVFFCVGLGTGWILNQQQPITVSSVRNPQTEYTFINPILYMETSEALSYPKYTPLKNALTEAVAKATGDSDANEVSIYFRDLNSSDWVGINPKESFDPASMLKVVTLIATLHSAESFPQTLSAPISIGPNFIIPSGDQDYYPPANPIKSGETYTVEQLMERTITESDNGANALLEKYIGSSEMTSVFQDLAIPMPNGTTGVTAQEYSHLFRVLYNATYLNSDDSEKALSLLSQTTFSQGLVSGVPAGTVVSHKFGEATIEPSQASTSSAIPVVHELHDCGIVYFPGHPYFLCVMTRGSNFPALAGVLKSISQVTWTQMQALYSK